METVKRVKHPSMGVLSEYDDDHDDLFLQWIMVSNSKNRTIKTHISMTATQICVCTVTNVTSTTGRFGSESEKNKDCKSRRSYT